MKFKFKSTLPPTHCILSRLKPSFAFSCVARFSPLPLEGQTLPHHCCKQLENLLHFSLLGVIERFNFYTLTSATGFLALLNLRNTHYVCTVVTVTQNPCAVNCCLKNVISRRTSTLKLFTILILWVDILLSDIELVSKLTVLIVLFPEF